MNNKKYIFILALIIISLISLLLLIPNISNEYIKTDIYISEVMANNYSTIQDNYGNYSDYIEIHNSTNKTINLEGYHLSDSEFDTKKWTFPKVEIKAHSYLIVYASNLNICSDDICHTNFKLSSEGEILTLTDNNGNIISKFSYPALDADVSYGFKNNKYIKFETPTPGYENNSNELKISKDIYKLLINEYMTHNKQSVYDSHGLYNDFIEIYNPTDDDITLYNVHISDDINDLKKFKIPKVVINKKDYLLIYLVKDRVDYTDNIYATFKLSDEDKYIIISDGNKIIDKVEIVKLPDDISYGRVGKEFKYFTTPTPGSINDTKYFDTIGGTNENS